VNWVTYPATDPDLSSGTQPSDSATKAFANARRLPLVQRKEDGATEKASRLRQKCTELFGKTADTYDKGGEIDDPIIAI
jgi:hypothetical protein